MSEIGYEFISAFSIHHSNQGSVETSSKIMSNIKKFLHIQKTRDSLIILDEGKFLISSKKIANNEEEKAVDVKTLKKNSIFYRFVLKSIHQLNK